MQDIHDIYTRHEIGAGRTHIANLARADGEAQFAREVLAGCWDHRNDVMQAIAGKRFAPKAA